MLLVRKSSVIQMKSCTNTKNRPIADNLFASKLLIAEKILSSQFILLLAPAPIR